MNDKKTVDCPIHKTEMPVSVCIARQKILDDAPADGNKGEAYKIYRKSCGKCKVGLYLYLLEKLKAKASTMGKPVKIKKDDVDNSTKEQSGEYKICAREGCGIRFFKDDTPAAAWQLKKYCCHECKKIAERAREKSRKKLNRKIVAGAKDFDLGKAEKIAMSVAEENLKLVSTFVQSSTHLEQMRALAVRVGIDSQKAAHDAVWR